MLAHHISEYQAKSLLCGPTEIGSLRGGQNVGIPVILDEPATFRLKNRPVDELHELFQAPETAFTDAQDCLKQNNTDHLIEMKLHLNDRIVSAFFLEFVLDVLQHQADHLDDRDDQGAKSQGARVVPGCVMNLSSRLLLT